MKHLNRSAFPVFSALFVLLAAPGARSETPPDAASAARDGVLDALRTMGTRVYGCADRKRGMTVGLVHADSRGIHTIAEEEDEGAAMMFNFGGGPASFEGYLVEKVSLYEKDPNYLVFSLRSTRGPSRRTLWLNVANPRSSAYTVTAKGRAITASLECSVARPSGNGSWQLPDFADAGSNTVAADARASERPFSERLRQNTLRWGERSRRAPGADPAY